MNKRAFLWLWLVPLGLMLVGIAYCISTVTIDDSNVAATQNADATLTANYGEVAQAVITNFEANWLSLDAHKDPSTQSNLASGAYLWYMGLARDRGATSEPWLITKSWVTTYVRIIEHTPQRLKVIGASVSSVDEVKPTGEFIQSLPIQHTCRLYLFVQDGGLWKAADVFDMSVDRYIARDWDNQVAWEKLYYGKQIMGDLPVEKCPTSDK